MAESVSFRSHAWMIVISIKPKFRVRKLYFHSSACCVVVDWHCPLVQSCPPTIVSWRYDPTFGLHRESGSPVDATDAWRLPSVLSPWPRFGPKVFGTPLTEASPVASPWIILRKHRRWGGGASISSNINQQKKIKRRRDAVSNSGCK